jgi:hypothetical protein
VVPRQLVHKHAVGEVFVTACRPTADGAAAVAGELPRTHSYYSDLGGFPVRPDAMPLLELCRQACLVLAHRAHHVPFGWQFILRTMSVEIFDVSAGIPGEQAYGPLRVLLHCSERQRWAAGREWEFQVSAADGGPFASAAVGVSWMPPDRWAKVRERARSRHRLRPEIGYLKPPRASVPATAVGRKSQRNVVITGLRHDAGLVRASMIVDLTNAGLFDHFSDHIPGMVQAEAARQLAIVAVTRSAGLPARRLRVGGLSLRFTRLGELDLPTGCIARPEQATPVTQHPITVRIMQAGGDIAQASVSVAEQAEGHAAPAISVPARRPG